jgi:hypothetical protein
MSGSGDGGDGVIDSRNLPNQAILGVGDVEISVSVDGDTTRRAELGLGGRTTVAAVALVAGSGDGRNGVIGRRYLPHPIIVAVGNVEVSMSVHSDIIRKAQFRLGGGSAVATVAFVLSGSGDDGDRIVVG